jgi:hypothetical protein|tara:strand:+ start:168 stop:863 length:696 start_codon:yes stop_codon:yes gene_type:complete
MKKVNVSQVLPKGQKEIIRKALNLYKQSIEGFDQHYDEIEYRKHDLISLIAFLDYDLSVTLSKDMKDKFAFLHGVDFPEYTEVDAKYPIETKSVDEWVTVMTGDFSFIDDGFHQREAHVNNLIGIQRHLRSQVEDVISDLDDGGHGWLVVEDYDGAIITDTAKEPVKDEREFQVTWLASHYDPKTEVVNIDHFGDDNGYEGVDRVEIDGLIETQSYETAEGGVVITRLRQN